MTTGTGRPKGARAEGWSKDTLLAELDADKEASVVDVCRKYAAEVNPRALVTEVERWRASDPEFGIRYDALLDLRAPNRNGGGLSKEERDPEALADWRIKYCTDLAESGSRIKAAENSPYQYTHIYQMLTESYPQYDKAFADMVHLVEMNIAAEMEGGFVWAFRECTDPQKKAWIADKWLTKRDPRRWGKQVEVTHKGKVEHEHTIVVSREERMERLLTDQRAFFGPKAVLSLTGERVSIDVPQLATAETLDAEYVELREVSEQSVQADGP